MEVVSTQFGDAGAGVVVRQFVPTRIERQVLAHVFALVCGPSCETAAGSPCGCDAAARCLADDDQPTEAFVAGRRAA